MPEPRIIPSPTGPPSLFVNPASLDFGSVATGTSATLGLQLSNPSDTDVVLIVPSVDNPAFTFSGIPSTLFSGDTIGVNVTYTAGAIQTDNGTLTIQAHADNSPLRIPLTGISTGTYALSINPSSGYFFSSTRVTTPPTSSDPVIFTMTNTGVPAVTITNITASVPFVVSGLPTFPATLNSGQALTVSVIFQPDQIGLNSSLTGLSVVWNTGTTNLLLQGVGLGFTMAFPATGSDMAIVALRNQSFWFQNSDLNSESYGQAGRWHDFGKPGLIKNYFATAIVYEDLGPAQLQFTARTHTDSQQLTIGLGDPNNPSTGDIMDVGAPFNKPAAYAINSIILRSGNGGPVSIHGIIHKYAVEEVYRGTVQIPANFTPAFTVSPIGLEIPIWAFSAPTMVLRGDSPLNFNADDADCVATREFAFQQLGFEQSLLRLELVYENLGETLMNVEASNRRELTVQQAVTIGQNPGDSTTQSKLVDLDVQDEVITLTLTRRSKDGPLWLSAFVLRHVPRGELKG